MKTAKKENMNVLLYRYENEELEVFLVKDKEGNREWQLPESSCCDSADFESLTGMKTVDNEEVIPLEEKDRETVGNKVFALEAKLEDAVDKLVEIRNNQGTFIALKEAFKKVMPRQYSLLKELQEVLTDRNLTKYI